MRKAATTAIYHFKRFQCPFRHTHTSQAQVFRLPKSTKFKNKYDEQNFKTTTCERQMQKWNGPTKKK